MSELGITLVERHGGDGTIGAGAVLGSDHPNFFNHVWAGDLEKARRSGARDRRLFEDWINPDLLREVRLATSDFQGCFEFEEPTRRVSAAADSTFDR